MSVNYRDKAHLATGDILQWTNITAKAASQALEACEMRVSTQGQWKYSDLFSQMLLFTGSFLGDGTKSEMMLWIFYLHDQCLLYYSVGNFR